MRPNTTAESIDNHSGHVPCARFPRNAGAVPWGANSDAVTFTGGFRIAEIKVNSTQSRVHSRYFIIKPWIDRILVVLLALPALLLLGIAALLVLFTCGRPIFYCQTRVGLRRQLFTLWKIRTMCANAEESSGPIWCGRGDPRVTWIGHFLRLTHLDELPQLWNVLAGDMSLIGPRPERPEIVRTLARAIPNYLDRLAVLPGITGWAQIHQDSDIDLGNVRVKQRFDLEYIRRASLLMDLQILIETFPCLFGMRPRAILRHAWQLLRQE
jgi:lipopolysaccharide/colanic/teichoic acid biosynthesis glycosyltransferase